MGLLGLEQTLKLGWAQPKTNEPNLLVQLDWVERLRSLVRFGLKNSNLTPTWFRLQLSMINPSQPRLQPNLNPSEL